MLALYIRVSTAHQQDKYSVTTQIQRGIEFAGSISEEYQIYQEVQSGGSIEGRERLNQTLKDIKAGLIQKVWVIESSRLTRNLEDAIAIQKIFSDHNVELYVNGTLTDFSSPEKILSYHITSAVSEYERKQITERSKRGKSKWQDEGLMAFPKLYGWNYKYREDGKKEWYTVENEVENIKLIFNTFLEKDKSVNRVRLFMNEQGIKTRIGGIWENARIETILKQTAYIGLVKDSRGILINSKIYTPIITKKTFDRAQQKLQKKKRDNWKWKDAENELTSLIHCRYCGAPYFKGNGRVRKDGTRRGYYYHYVSVKRFQDCEQTIRTLDKNKLELQVSNFIWDEFLDKEEEVRDWWFSVREFNLQKKEQIDFEIRGLEEKLNRLSEKKVKLVNLAVDGTLSKDDIRQNINQINKEIKGCEALLGQKQEMVRHVQLDKDEEYVKSMIQLALNYEKLSELERRNLYQFVFKSIEYDGKALHIELFNGEKRKKLIKRK